MADHPLRPATDRCLGRPLPYQLANRTRTPPSARALRPLFTSRSYAVLARVSPCYSPLKGRSSTRYSPVRRSTGVLLLRLARLACVKHAASVHSEPGSNSPVELKKLEALTSIDERLMLIFGYCLCVSDESYCRTQRNHVCLRCFPIQLSKNRPHGKGGKIARPSQPCQAECFRSLRRTHSV